MRIDQNVAEGGRATDQAQQRAPRHIGRAPATKLAALQATYGGRASEFMDVEDFHRKMGIPQPDKVTGLDQLGAAGLDRLDHLKEELIEFKRAFDAGDVEKQLDALIDLVYVAMGGARMMGVDALLWAWLWAEVQRANMEKEPSPGTGKGGVVKPPGWRPPNLRRILEEVTCG